MSAFITPAERAEIETSFKRCRPGTIEAICAFREGGSQEDLETAVRGIVDRYIPPESEFNIDDAPGTARLREDLGIDSLSMLEIVMSLEEALGIRIPDEDLKSLVTFDDAIRGLQMILGSTDGEGEVESEEKSYGREEILKILPHQPPFYFLDSATVNGEELNARFTPDPDADYLTGHFPGNPVLPASIVFEALGQAASLWVMSRLEEDPRLKGPVSEVLFGSIESARFRRKVLPGEVVDLHTRVLHVRAPIISFEATAQVDGEPVATVEELVLILQP